VAATTVESSSANQRGSSRGVHPGTKPKVKEEQNDEEAAKAAKIAEYLHRQRLIASSDNHEDFLGLNSAFMRR
jgi:hypothetical protein